MYHLKKLFVTFLDLVDLNVFFLLQLNQGFIKAEANVNISFLVALFPYSLFKVDVENKFKSSILKNKIVC